MKINTINYRQYFIDNIKINWQLPMHNATMEEKDLLRSFYSKFIRLQLNPDTEFKIQHATIMPKDNFFNIRCEWHGSFWSYHQTKRINHDLIPWYKSFLKLDQYINYVYFSYLGNTKRKLLTTVARLDIARNHNGNLADAIPIHHPNIKNISNQLGYSKKKPYITGLSIGKRTAESGTFFRAYDKRFDLDGIESSLLRFGSINYVRKEWELKRKTLRRWNIVTPEDMKNYLCNPKTITEIIYRLRKVQDCILEKDTKTYNSIHDMVDKARINPSDGYTMNGNEFNKMLKKDYSVLLNKANPKKIKNHFWNPFKQVNALIESKGQYLTENEMLTLISKIIGEYSTNEIEVENYETKVNNVLDIIKNDKRIKKSLEIIDTRKKEINRYTKSLMKKE